MSPFLKDAIESIILSLYSPHVAACKVSHSSGNLWAEDISPNKSFLHELGLHQNSLQLRCISISSPIAAHNQLSMMD